MLHLPALKITNEIEKVLRAAKDMRLAVRGLYGEEPKPWAISPGLQSGHPWPQ